MQRIDQVFGGLLGLCVGDALGVPVEFKPREYLKAKPLKGMIGYGTHNQPEGTWSDDSSLTFCLLESIYRCGTFDVYDLSRRFCKWYDKAYWTPHGNVFDIGNATIQAINRIKYGIQPVKAGGKREGSNGNGSLMRILPLAYYTCNLDLLERVNIIHKCSSITHGHARSQIACVVYIELAINLLKGQDLKQAYENMKSEILRIYNKEPYLSELGYFGRILKEDISLLRENRVRSTGYVIDTLEAAIWCLLNSNSYAETALKAVNLGEDTDTTAAVAGGLAGIYYGFNAIPREWIDCLARKEDILELVQRFYMKIYSKI